MEGTAGVCTFNVDGVKVLSLIELCCGTTRCISTNIHVIHWQTLSVIIRHDVRVAELSSHVIFEVNLLLHFVKAAGCSPVCGSAADAVHSSQSLAIDVPVWSVVINWCVLHKRFTFELTQIIFQTP